MLSSHLLVVLSSDRLPRNFSTKLLHVFPVIPPSYMRSPSSHLRFLVSGKYDSPLTNRIRTRDQVTLIAMDLKSL